MAYGLQIKDASGNMVVDTTDIELSRLGRVLGIYLITTSTGSITATGINQGVPFAMLGGASSTDSTTPWAWLPDATISGTTISWDFGSLPFNQVYMVYGFY